MGSGGGWGGGRGAGVAAGDSRFHVDISPEVSSCRCLGLGGPREWRGGGPRGCFPQPGGTPRMGRVHPCAPLGGSGSPSPHPRCLPGRRGVGRILGGLRWVLTPFAPPPTPPAALCAPGAAPGPPQPQPRRGGPGPAQQDQPLHPGAAPRHHGPGPGQALPAVSGAGFSTHMTCETFL